MKRLLILSTELLSLIIIAFLLGRYIDKKLFLEGWATVACLFVGYGLWFLSFYRRFR